MIIYMSAPSVILIVDDQIQNIELLAAYLEPQGYDVIYAMSGVEALTLLSTKHIDLILLDVMMPGMDGFEVTRRIRQDDSFRYVPIILVTALQKAEDRINGIDANCDDFISKPLDKSELLVRVKSHLKIKAFNELLRDYQQNLEIEVAQRSNELSQALENLKIASLETIHRLSVASEYKDAGTGGHIKRMSLYSAALSRHLGLDEKTTELILNASPMHDIGKIGIPDMILLKPGKHTEDEWEIMKLHATIGGEILKGSSMEIIQLGETIARLHHEKWDGSGYPFGYKGEDIPFICRIVAVADVFDALTSERPYKKAFTPDLAMDIINEGKGTHFDPKVVDALFSIYEEIIDIKSRTIDEDHEGYSIEKVRATLLQYISKKP